MPALELSQLRGHGAPSGGAAGSDADGDDNRSLPTFAPTDASGMPGDLEDNAGDAELVLKPQWDVGPREHCSAGVWVEETGGGGEDVKGKGGKGSSHGGTCGKGSGPAGTFGVLTANWGGKWADPALHAHMQQDLKSSSAQFLIIQEASADLLDYVEQDPGRDPRHGDGERSPAKFIGVRGPEEGDSTMICGRASLVSGMRLLAFHRSKDGQYTVTPKNKAKTKVTKTAVSRIMIASAKMRFWTPRGSGEDDSDDHELRFANVHLHFKTARKGLLAGGQSYKRFWDLLARYLAEFRPRILCGDFNMALFLVVPELRARGFQINLAAWYPWMQQHETSVRADSCGIFRLGPCEGVRMCYGISALGLEGPDLPANCAMVMETLRDENGKETEKRPYTVTNVPHMGQGYPLSTYHPQVPARREQCVKWSFTPVFDEASSAVTEVLDRAKNSKEMFPYRVDSTTGSASWSWPNTPVSKQKPVKFDKFDPYREFFKRGAHMPLMIYVGGHSDVRRTGGARQRRAANADRRGWTYEWRQSTKPSGKGKGDGQQKGAGAYGRGGAQPRDNRGKGWTWGARDQGQQAPWTGWW